MKEHKDMADEGSFSCNLRLISGARKHDGDNLRNLDLGDGG